MADIAPFLPSWFEFLSLTLCTGALMGLHWLIPPSYETAEIMPRCRVALQRLLAIGIASALASGCAELLMRGAEMGDVPFLQAFPVLPQVLGTHFGHLWLMRMAALAVLAVTAAAIAMRERRTGACAATPGNGLSWLMVVMVGVASFSQSATGHAAASGDFNLAEVMDWLHLLAVLVWGGGFAALSLAILKGDESEREESAPLAAESVSRFSRAAGCAVALVAATAAYNTAVNMGDLDEMMATSYGWIIAGKSVLFLVLLEFGVYNRYVCIPALRQWGGLAPLRRSLVGRVVETLVAPLGRLPDGGHVVRKMRASLRFEAVLVAVMLFLAAMLRHEAPAKHAQHPLQQGPLVHEHPRDLSPDERR